MKYPHGRVVWLTGASSGIGAATAQALCEAGYRVYGTSRKSESEAHENPNGGMLQMLRMDVTDEASVNAAASRILALEGRIDIVINCAGMGIAGSVEDTSMQEAELQWDTNVWGVLRVLQASLPVMRAQKRGLVLNVGSVAGLVPLPYQGFYSAGKHALEALTGALRHELKPFGVHAAMVEPGDCRTGFTDARRSVERAARGAYASTYAYALEQMAKDERGGMEPDKVAGCIMRIIRRKRPALHHYCGFKYHVLMLLVKLFPAAWMEKAVAMMYLPARSCKKNVKT